MIFKILNFSNANTLSQLTLAGLNFFIAANYSVNDFGFYSILIMYLTLFSFFHLNYVNMYYLRISKKVNSLLLTKQYLSNFFIFVVPLGIVEALIISFFIDIYIIYIFIILFFNQLTQFYLYYNRAIDNFSEISKILYSNSLIRGLGVLLFYIFNLFSNTELNIFFFIILYSSSNIISLLLFRTNIFYKFISTNITTRVISFKKFKTTLKSGYVVLVNIYITFFLNNVDKVLISMLLTTTSFGIIAYYKLFGAFIIAIIGSTYNGYFFPKFPQYIKKENLNIFYKSLFILFVIIITYNIISPYIIKYYTLNFSSNFSSYFNLINVANSIASIVFFLGLKNSILLHHNKKQFLLNSILIIVVPTLALFLYDLISTITVNNVLLITLYSYIVLVAIHLIIDLFKNKDLKHLFNIMNLYMILIIINYFILERL